MWGRGHLCQEGTGACASFRAGTRVIVCTEVAQCVIWPGICGQQLPCCVPQPPASGCHGHSGQSAGRKPGIKGLTSPSGCPGALFGTLAPARPKVS